MSSFAKARLISLVAPGTYLVLSVVTLWIWSARGVYPLIGDEPHYLVIGDALWRFGSLDVTGAYQSELLNRVFYPPGLGDVNASVTDYGHVVPGDRGVFSWHGYFLGWIAGVPVTLFGVEAARWVMVGIGAGIAVVVWWSTGAFFTSPRLRVLVAVTLVVTYPFLLASVQIFPDFVAGGLVLLGITWLIRTDHANAMWWSRASVAFLVALLPWLGIKFAPIAAILLIAMAVRSRDRWWQVLAPGVLSAAFLMAFNTYAYGSPFGSLAEGTVEFGGDFWIRMAGLLIDQNQGALLFNPILWLGLAGLISFLRRDALVGAVWVLSFGILWLLGAAHPGWYGGGSFVGRYSWGMALLLMLPAMVALASVRSRSRLLFSGLVAGSLAFSAWVFILGVFVSEAGPGIPLGLDFYNKPLDTWLESYSVLWFPLQDFLAAFYNPQWVWGYLINYGWMIIAIAAVVLGAVGASTRMWLVFGASALAVVVTLGLISEPGTRTVRQQQDVQVVPSGSSPGVVAGGPVWLMREGPYSWIVHYQASAPSIDVIGRWELVRAQDEVVVASGELQGTAGQEGSEVIETAFRSLQPRQFFLRIVWNGNAIFEIVETGVQHGL